MKYKKKWSNAEIVCVHGRGTWLAIAKKDRIKFKLHRATWKKPMLNDDMLFHPNYLRNEKR